MSLPIIEAERQAARPTISVIVCAYTEDRWEDLLAALGSISRQTLAPVEVLVVIDHNPALFERAGQVLHDVRLVENLAARGLSGARNTAIDLAQGDWLAFMDEDALAAPDWLERLSEHFQRAQVLGVGGAIIPLWLGEQPAWFPEEFNWVVGCTYRGMPTQTAAVRNLIGCNMAFRREVFAGAGGFQSGIGRIGTVPLGCEETELCIRAGQRWPEGRFIYEPTARVTHRVPDWRGSLRYFRARCYAEGLSKALVASLVGTRDGLDSERAYVRRTLPQGIARGLVGSLLGRDRAGWLRAGAIIIGLFTTAWGYLVGKTRQGWKKASGRITNQRRVERGNGEYYI